MATTRKPISIRSAEVERESINALNLDVEARLDVILEYAYNTGLPDLLIKHLRAVRAIQGQATRRLQAYNHAINEGRLGELLPLPDEQETIQ